jgi:hypothetical protein
MNSQELRALQEAYLEVVENQQLDEISDELVGRAVNKRIAQSGAAQKREMQDRTPENMRASSKAGEKEASMKSAAARRRERKSAQANESVDLYDIILSHLLDEGYADTEQAAEAIMVNMSEDWRESIVEGEEKKEEPQKPFTGEGPKKPKGWRPTGPKLKSGQRPGYAR